jgi:hypothetical protein
MNGKRKEDWEKEDRMGGKEEINDCMGYECKGTYILLFCSDKF